MQSIKLLALLFCLVACRTKEENKKEQQEEYDDAEEGEVPHKPMEAEGEEMPGPLPVCLFNYGQFDRTHTKNDIEYEFNRTKEGYVYQRQKFPTDIYPDSSKHNEEGVIINPGTDKEELDVKGQYSYKVGNFLLVVEYTADRNGYRPKVFWKQYPCEVTFQYKIGEKLLQNLSG